MVVRDVIKSREEKQRKFPKFVSASSEKNFLKKFSFIFISKAYEMYVYIHNRSIYEKYMHKTENMHKKVFTEKKNYMCSQNKTRKNETKTV